MKSRIVLRGGGRNPFIFSDPPSRLYLGMGEEKEKFRNIIERLDRMIHGLCVVAVVGEGAIFSDQV